MFRLPSFPLYATLADKLGWWAVRALCVAVLAFLLAPILVMVPLSFSESSFLAYPIHGWSLKWYQNLFESPEWARAARNSFIVPRALGSILRLSTASSSPPSIPSGCRSTTFASISDMSRSQPKIWMPAARTFASTIPRTSLGLTLALSSIQAAGTRVPCQW